MLGREPLIDVEAFLGTIGDDHGFLDTVIALFKEQSDDTLNGIRAAIAQRDWDAFNRAAHDLKNIGRAVACKRLVDHSNELEELIAGQQLLIAVSLVGQTEKLLSRTLKELNKIRKRFN